MNLFDRMYFILFRILKTDSSANGRAYNENFTAHFDGEEKVPLGMHTFSIFCNLFLKINRILLFP